MTIRPPRRNGRPARRGVAERGAGRQPGTWAAVYEWFTKSRQAAAEATLEAAPHAVDAPFMLGPFAVDAVGRLAPRGPTALPGFFFHWRGRLIRAEV